jgi:hypothetical protein
VHAPRVAKSFSKGEPLGSQPPCAICMGRGEGERGRLTLPGGVSVWLCAAHRSPAFQRPRAGRDFASSLSCVWEAAGCYTARRRRALELRREAEGRWAKGQPLRRVIDTLRATARRGLARPPSRTTLYRWHAEARWRAGPVPGITA